MDAGYGHDSKLRAGIADLGKHSAADAGVEAGHAAGSGTEERSTVTRPIRSW
jgi:hypothetical protein